MNYLWKPQGFIITADTKVDAGQEEHTLEVKTK